jgi:hypothetical protein
MRRRAAEVYTEMSEVKITCLYHPWGCEKKEPTGITSTPNDGHYVGSEPGIPVPPLTTSIPNENEKRYRDMNERGERFEYRRRYANPVTMKMNAWYDWEPVDPLPPTVRDAFTDPYVKKVRTGTSYSDVEYRRARLYRKVKKGKAKKR